MPPKNVVFIKKEEDGFRAYWSHDRERCVKYERTFFALCTWLDELGFNCEERPEYPGLKTHEPIITGFRDYASHGYTPDIGDKCHHCNCELHMEGIVVIGCCTFCCWHCALDHAANYPELYTIQSRGVFCGGRRWRLETERELKSILNQTTFLRFIAA